MYLYNSAYSEKHKKQFGDVADLTSKQHSMLKYI